MDALNQYMELSRHLRSIITKAYDIVSAFAYEGDSYVAFDTIRYIKDDIRYLRRAWPVPDSPILSKLETAISMNLKNVSDKLEQWNHIITVLIPDISDELDDLYISLGNRTESYGLEGLIHPIIIRSSYRQYIEGLYRDAVLNAIVAVFDLIRERTGFAEDGVQLVGKAFSIDNPVLILSTLDTDSGMNEQKGFIQILQGSYIGIRNPKAHSLQMNPTKDVAAQYLVFASLLARRIEEARVIKPKIM